jgi:hypothetical protein
LVCDYLIGNERNCDCSGLPGAYASAMAAVKNKT